MPSSHQSTFQHRLVFRAHCMCFDMWIKTGQGQTVKRFTTGILKCLKCCYSCSLGASTWQQCMDQSVPMAWSGEQTHYACISSVMVSGLMANSCLSLSHLPRMDSSSFPSFVGFFSYTTPCLFSCCWCFFFNALCPMEVEWLSTEHYC